MVWVLGTFSHSASAGAKRRVASCGSPCGPSSPPESSLRCSSSAPVQCEGEHCPSVEERSVSGLWVNSRLRVVTVCPEGTSCPFGKRVSSPRETTRWCWNTTPLVVSSFEPVEGEAVLGRGSEPGGFAMTRSLWRLVDRAGSRNWQVSGG